MNYGAFKRIWHILLAWNIPEHVTMDQLFQKKVRKNGHSWNHFSLRFSFSGLKPCFPRSSWITFRQFSQRLSVGQPAMWKILTMWYVWEKDHPWNKIFYLASNFQGLTQRKMVFCREKISVLLIMLARY